MPQSRWYSRNESSTGADLPLTKNLQDLNLSIDKFKTSEMVSRSRWYAGLRASAIRISRLSICTDVLYRSILNLQTTDFKKDGSPCLTTWQVCSFRSKRCRPRSMRSHA